MSLSYAQKFELNCQKCHYHFDADLWIVLDIAQRPDLLEQIRTRRWHFVLCPNCEFEQQADAALLVFNSNGEPRLVFSPAYQTTPEETQQQAIERISYLRETLGKEWQENWLDKGLLSVPREMLFAILRHDSEVPHEQTSDIPKQSVSRGISEELTSILKEILKLVRPADMPERIRLCQQGLNLLKRDHNPQLWATLCAELASSLQQSSQGNLEDNLERAIECYTIALEVFTSQTFSKQWATVQNNLAAVYRDRVGGNRADNLEQAIQHCMNALEVRTLDTSPKEWASTQNNLGNAYRDRVQGDREDNLERAIQHYTDALQGFQQAVFPEDWAKTQNNLGNAYRDRIRRDRKENLEKAIHHYKKSLKVRRRDAFPEEWAIAQNNLGDAYRDLMGENRAENLERAIQHYTNTLEIYTRQAFPKKWAGVQSNLGLTYNYRISGYKADNLEQAIQHYESALEVFSLDALPDDWAMVQNNLAIAYANRIYEDKADNLERAIQHYGNALQVYTRQVLPQDWAMAQNNLAIAYNFRIRGDRANNLEQAIQHYINALEFYTRQKFPEEWATVQHNLGLAYKDRIRGDRADNLELAIQHYKNALDIRTREAFPEYWAKTQNNLASAFYHRILGDKADNFEQAIHYYCNALAIRTREAFPEQWANTQNNLANIYNYRIRGDRTENLERALQHYTNALTVFNRQTFPQQWASAQNNLGGIYYDRIRGDRKDNLEQAIQHYINALEVLKDPIQRLEAGQFTGQLAAEAGNWLVAANGFITAVEANRSLFDASLPSKDSRDRLLKRSQYLYPDAAYALVRAGNLKKAVEVIESGRARQLREAMESNRLDLQRLPELGFGTLADAYAQALQARDNLIAMSEDNRPDNWLRLLSTATDVYEKIAADIREQVGNQHPEFRYFMQALPFEVIQSQAQYRPLVYLFVAERGGMALVITGDDTQVIELPHLTHNELIAKILGKEDESAYLQAYIDWRHDPYNDKQREAWKQALDNTLNWCWQSITEPIVSTLHDILKSDEQIVLIPSGLLGLLPLHAAWTRDESSLCGRKYAFDEFIFTYAPNANALWLARFHDAATESLLMVENPNADLYFSEPAARAALAHFEHQQHCSGADASVEGVSSAFSQFNVLYFFTHGIANFNEPLQSRLELADHRILTIQNILKLNTDHARLAVLSACETSVQPELDKLDEVISLPVSLIQAGVPAVIGSLWTVLESSTAILMTIFFEQWRVRGLSTPAALRKAQFTLRDAMYSKEAREYFKDSLPEINLSPVEVAGVLHKELKTYSDEFAHPFYWAAFIYTGL